eukprot:11489520-Ditylum_brightwellii.AAC.1
MEQFYRCKDKKMKKEKESTENHNFAYDDTFDPPSGVSTCLTWKKAPTQKLSCGLVLLISELKKDQKRQKIT